MSDYTTLGQLEETHNDAVRAAKVRIEQAEEFIHSYRTQMHRMQEDFYALATREGVADAPEFREELHRVSDRIEENVHGAAQVLAGFEEELAIVRMQYSEEREELLWRHRTNSDDSR